MKQDKGNTELAQETHVCFSYIFVSSKQMYISPSHKPLLYVVFQKTRRCWHWRRPWPLRKRIYDIKKKIINLPGQNNHIIILPGQDKHTLICLGKIIILPRQDIQRLICLGKISTHQVARARKIIILPRQDNHPFSFPSKIIFDLQLWGFIHVYFTLGFSRKGILRCLPMNHGAIISSGHLHRVLRQHGLTWRGKTILSGQINV